MPAAKRTIVTLRMVALTGTLFLVTWMAAQPQRPAVHAAPALQSADEGKAIFEQQCTSCHTIGGGDLVGPDLQNVTQQRERDWLIRWITEPDRMLEEGDPIATELYQQYNQVAMPNLGLSEANTTAVLAYIESQSDRAGEPISDEQRVAGDPVVGRDYFTGARRFENGGPSCLACHSVTGIGALGGGTMGPDLTNVHSRFGQAGLSAFLRQPATPTMQAVWGPAPLTADEIGHLAAFLEAADMNRPVSAVGQLAGLAGVGALLLLGLIHVSWHNRLKDVRKSLIER